MPHRIVRHLNAVIICSYYQLLWRGAPDRELYAHWYEPRNIAPPALIQRTRGPMPAKKALGPLSLKICLRSGITAVFSFANIILVFRTSSGVVNPAAMAPAALPNSPLSKAVILSFPDFLRLYSFIDSHNGNWITVNGTSLIIVTNHPRYSSNHTPDMPTVRC